MNDKKYIEVLEARIHNLEYAVVLLAGSRRRYASILEHNELGEFMNPFCDAQMSLGMPTVADHQGFIARKDLDLPEGK